MMSPMHEADRSIWREIDNGTRPIDWAAWFGHPDAADYLSPSGQELTTRMVQFFEEFFGPRWLPAAMLPAKNGSGPPVVGLGRFSPVLDPFNGGRPGQWSEALRWWAALQLLHDRAVPGLTKVRNNTRRDITLPKALHTLAQTRLAVLGAHCGANVTLEPSKAAGPGDILLETGQTRVFIEVVTVTEDQFVTDQHRAHDRHVRHLFAVDSRYHVHWQGDLPGQLNRTDQAAWQRQTEEAAARCVQTQSEATVPLPGGGTLRVRPGNGPVGTTLSSPTVERDQGRRLVAKIEGKAAQSQDAGTAWIWIEDHGVLYPHTRFAQLPLSQQVAELSALLGPILVAYPHLAGIVYTNASRQLLPLPGPQTEQHRDGLGLVRGIPLDRVRRTIIVNPRLVQAGQTSLVERMIDHEPAWIDWALPHLGVRGGLASLLAAAPVRLWTPA